MDIPQFTSVIIVTTNGDIALQLRDDKPTIVDPNCLSLFAGRLREDESKETGAARELKEETMLDIRPENLEFLFSHTVENEPDNMRVSHVFRVTNIKESDMDVQEGQGYRLIRTVHDLNTNDFAPISKQIMLRYFDQFDN